MRRTLHITLLAIVALLAASCANTARVLRPSEHLLVRNTFVLEMADSTEVSDAERLAFADHNRYVRQRPKNGVFHQNLSLLNTYFWVSPADTSWLARTMRNLGTQPVVYKPALAEVSAKQIEGMLHGKGMFHSSVAVDTHHLSHSHLEAVYRISASHRYRIREVLFIATDPSSDSLVRALQSESLLHKGDYYDQDLISAERDRISSTLLLGGYYLASPQLVSFIIDTTYASNLLSIEVHISNPLQYVDGNIVQHPFQRYYFDSITFNANKVSSSAIQHVLSLKTGDLYNPRRVAYNYNALLGLRNFNLINFDFYESPRSTDTMRLLNTHIRLHNSSQQQVSLSLELSNASPISKESANSGNFGLETVLSYQHRNLFGGAELFTLEANFLSELRKDVFRKSYDDFRSNFSAFETGLNATIDLPYFLFPFANTLMRRQIRPHTLIGVGGAYQYRSYFERIQANISFGYTIFANRRIQHKFYPIEAAYVRFPMLSDELQRRLHSNNSLRLLYQYNDHLIINLRYELLFNSQLIGSRTDFSYFKGSIESAGVLTSLIATTSNISKCDQYGAYMIGNVPYSQYLRFSTEYKHYFYHDEKNSFVLRAVAGLGIPYGNSQSMPYEKSFFGGGPNNLRAWHIRRLGPGHYNTHSAETFYFDQAGDITLVLNLEERFPLFNFLEGAVFADMGNVWMYSENSETAGSAFRLNNFFKDIAVGVGIGLRFKISIITLRFDFASPIYDPNYDAAARWRIRHWRPSLITTNFGIDYPF